MALSGTPANVVRVGVAALGSMCALAVWSIVRGSGRFTTYAGRSGPASTMFVGAGLGLIVAGLFTSRRRSLVGLLAVLAGFVWFAPAWDGWEGGPPSVREVGMLASALVLPLLLNLVVAAAWRMTPITSLMVVTTYVLLGLCAVVLVLVRDPYLDPHCWTNCTTKLLVVRARPQLASTLVTVDLWLRTLAAAALIATCVMALVTSRRRLWPMLTGGVLLGLATVTQSLMTIHRGFEDPHGWAVSSAFFAQCGAVLILAGGLLWEPFRSRRVRWAMARVVASLDDAQTVGSLEDALAKATRDPNLRVAYWLPAVGRHSDADGQPVNEPSTSNGVVATPVVRDGQRIAVISHATDPTELERILGADLRLALDNERLQAEVLAQMHDLRESRARIVEAGDERRRRLERNLHDGAQQSLLGLSYDLRLARAAAATKGDDELTAMLDSASTEVGRAFAELRELAHGIFPAVLTEAGLGAAVSSLAETSVIPVDVDYTVTERLPATVETAAYAVVADGLHAVSGSGAARATITIARHEDHIVVDVTPDRCDGLPDMVHVADRVGAAGGTLLTAPIGLRAVIPCAS